MEADLGQSRAKSGVTLERGSASRRPLVVVLYSLTLALSAGLVFMVQPMFARFVLPTLGGTPAVWNTAMLFFQTALLLAYLYAHWSTRRFGPRRQAALHLAIVAAAMIVLPIGVPGWDPPAGRLAGPVAARRARGGRRPPVLRGLVDRAAAPELARRHRSSGRARPLLPLPGQQHRQRHRPAGLSAAGGAAPDARRPEPDVVARVRAARGDAHRMRGGAVALAPRRHARGRRRQRGARAHHLAAPGALGGDRRGPVEPDAGRDHHAHDQRGADPAAVGPAARALPDLVHPRVLARRGRRPLPQGRRCTPRPRCWCWSEACSWSACTSRSGRSCRSTWWRSSRSRSRCTASSRRTARRRLS